MPSYVRGWTWAPALPSPPGGARGPLIGAAVPHRGPGPCSNPGMHERAAESRRVLGVVTSADRYLKTGRATGLWIGELTHFWEILRGAGIALEVASLRGGPVAIDPVSEGLLGGGRRATEEFLADERRRASLERSVALPDVDLAGFDAIYFAGGHGAMFDFRGSEAIAAATGAVAARGGLVAAVCHGVAALVDLEGSEGPLVRGREVTGYSRLEERLALRWSEVPFQLEDALIARGAKYRRSLLPFVPHVCVDGNLLTGQNPQSTRLLARRVVERLRGP